MGYIPKGQMCSTCRLAQSALIVGRPSLLLARSNQRRDTAAMRPGTSGWPPRSPRLQDANTRDASWPLVLRASPMASPPRAPRWLHEKS
eukprot:scaffold198606_cov24-Prasinocladus_malaysianus.AAC.1